LLNYAKASRCNSKKNKEKIDEELESILNQKKEFDKERAAYDLEKSRLSPSKSMKSTQNVNASDLKSIFQSDNKKEKAEYEKKIEEIIKKNEKEISSYKRMTDLKDKKKKYTNAK